MTSHEFACPYCGQRILIPTTPGAGAAAYTCPACHNQFRINVPMGKTAASLPGNATEHSVSRRYLRRRRRSLLSNYVVVWASVLALVAAIVVFVLVKDDGLLRSVFRLGPQLPSDFAFLPMTTAKGELDIFKSREAGKEFTLEITFKFSETRGWLWCGSDAVQGLHGQGLAIRQLPGNNFVPKMVWSPESFACYRHGKLLGIWDAQQQAFRAARSGESPTTIQKSQIGRHNDAQR